MPYELVPIYDMTAMGPDVYAGNPALKLPILRVQGEVLFGALNICRAIDERAERPARVIWPEELRSVLSRNAQELVWHAMAAQVQWVMGTVVGKLPAENVYFSKGAFRARRRVAVARCAHDRCHVGIARVAPGSACSKRPCFASSITWCFARRSVSRRIRHWFVLHGEFAERPSAQQTAYRFDTPPPAA